MKLKGYNGVPCGSKIDEIAFNAQQQKANEMEQEFLVTHETEDNGMLKMTCNLAGDLISIDIYDVSLLQPSMKEVLQDSLVNTFNTLFWRCVEKRHNRVAPEIQKGVRIVTGGR